MRHDKLPRQVPKTGLLGQTAPGKKPDPLAALAAAAKSFPYGLPMAAPVMAANGTVRPQDAARVPSDIVRVCVSKRAPLIGAAEHLPRSRNRVTFASPTACPWRPR